MKFNIGDKVAVLEEPIRGVVIQINGRGIAVKESCGTIYYFEPSELIKIEVEQDSLSNFSEGYNQLFKQKQLEKSQKKTKPTKTDKISFLEVDLHIEELSSNPKTMSNYQMLSLQIETARTKLEYAIEMKIPRIIFIHGVGKGVLKSELLFLLSKYPVKHRDASYREYGLGATEVFIH